MNSEKIVKTVYTPNTQQKLALRDELVKEDKNEALATTSATTTHTESSEAHNDGIVVALKPEILGHIGGFPISNSFVTSVTGSLILVVVMLLLVRNLKIVPGKIQLLFEYIVEGGYNYCVEVLEDEKVAKKVFPLVASFFIFIVFFNLIKFIPGAESVTYSGHLLFKPLHSDLNMTFALGLVAFLFIQFVGVSVLGVFKYGSKFINFKKPWTIPLGLIELISECAKLISLSFRLFGNILVGGIILALVSHMQHFVAPIFVMLFEIFVAFLQAGIFALLTLIYVKLAISEPH